MRQYCSLFIFLLFLSACGSNNNESSSSTSYKYQISGTTSQALSLHLFDADKKLMSFYHEEMGVLSNNFVIKWNEDALGNVTGTYTNQSTGESLPVTGTSTVIGRELVIIRPVAISGVLTLRFIITQTGDLSGPVNATLRVFDDTDQQVGGDEVITVTAVTQGHIDDDNGGDDGENFSGIRNCNGSPYQVQAQISVQIIPDSTEFGYSANLEYNDDLPISFSLYSVPLTEHAQCANTPCLKHTEIQNGKILNVIGWKEGANFYLNLSYFNEDNYDVNITCSGTLMATP